MVHRQFTMYICNFRHAQSSSAGQADRILRRLDLDWPLAACMPSFLSNFRFTCS